jgi:pilus assembly protein CpaE
MAQNIPIVIIDSDPDSINKMAKYIKDLSNHAVVEGMATTFEHGYEMIHKKRPLVVIMEVGNDIDSSLQKMSSILERFPQISIFVTCEDKSSDTILKVIRAGAAEYLLRPVTEQDLDSALQKMGRLWITKPAPEAQGGSIYTLFSPKGGVGVTTISTNIATNIFKSTDQPTLLVDLDLDAGDVTTFLNMKTSYTISDVTLNISRLDESFLKGVIARHESGMYVLAEPQRVEEGVSIPGNDIRKLLGLLKTMFTHIVIDTENILDDRTMPAIEMSDMIILVFVMSLPGIKHVQRHLRYFENMGITKDRIKLVVNRYIKKGDIKVDEAEKVLNHPIFWSIPNDYDSAMSSMNKGVPVSVYKPKSYMSSAIEGLSKAIVNYKE